MLHMRMCMYRSAVNRNTEMAYRIRDLRVIRFFYEWTQIGVNDKRIWRVDAKCRCMCFIVLKTIGKQKHTTL